MTGETTSNTERILSGPDVILCQSTASTHRRRAPDADESDRRVIGLTVINSPDIRRIRQRGGNTGPTLRVVPTEGAGSKPTLICIFSTEADSK